MVASWQVAEVDFDVVFADGDFLDQGFDNLAFAFTGHVGPEGSQVTGFGQDLVSGEETDLEEID